MIILRRWPDHSEEMLNDLYAHVNQKYCLTRLTCPLPPEATERYLQAVRTGFVNGKPFVCFLILLDDIPIGKTELTRYENGIAEVDIVIREEYTGNGYGREAMRQLLNYVDEAGWCSGVSAYIDKDNAHARRMFLRAGFRQTRGFEADIMTPVNGKYVLKTRTGYEYLYRFQEDK